MWVMKSVRKWSARVVLIMRMCFEGSRKTPLAVRSCLIFFYRL